MLLPCIQDMARNFEVDEQLFGPVSLTEPKKALIDMAKEEMKRHIMIISAEICLIKQGYNCVKEQI